MTEPDRLPRIGVGDTSARIFYCHQAMLLALAGRNPGLFTQPAVPQSRVCNSTGYCGCTCRNCLGGRHRCGHRKGCHKNCPG